MSDTLHPMIDSIFIQNSRELTKKICINNNLTSAVDISAKYQCSKYLAVDLLRLVYRSNQDIEQLLLHWSCHSDKVAVNRKY